jgi:RimJ/RimL family protein N-acetyltransferase
MVPLETERLTLGPVKEGELAQLLEVFVSNPDYLAWTEGDEYDLKKLQRDWQMVEATPGRHMLGLRERETGALVGAVEYIELNEHDGHPWIGLIIVREGRKRAGLAGEAMTAVMEQLEMSWASPVRISVIARNEPGMRLALSLGFTPYGEAEQWMAQGLERLILLECRSPRFQP